MRGVTLTAGGVAPAAGGGAVRVRAGSAVCWEGVWKWGEAGRSTRASGECGLLLVCSDVGRGRAQYACEWGVRFAGRVFGSGARQGTVHVRAGSAVCW